MNPTCKGCDLAVNIHLFLGDEKIGVIKHHYVYNDEINSGRDICEGCLLVLHDFKYRVEKVNKIPDGFEAYVRFSNE